MRTPDPDSNSGIADTARTLAVAARPRVLAVALAACALAAPAARGDDVKPLTLQAVQHGDCVYFVVAIARPQDMAAQSIETTVWERRRDGWPRMAELRGEPAWRVPCYQETQEPEWPGGPAPRLDRLTFVGRCDALAALPLKLRYPLADGTCREATLSPDLKAAEKLEDGVAAEQRWAKAEATWFAVMASCTGDLGGFFMFAAQQTRRRFDLPKAEQESQPWTQPRGPIEDRMYDLTTGAIAVQESLQLDRMTNSDRDRSERTVRFEDIPAVGIASHPFDKMRGDAEPTPSPLAALTPHDFYYARFANAAKLLDLLDFADQWGGSLLQLAEANGSDYGTRPRTMRQLGLVDTGLRERLGPDVLAELAVIGSDPYFRSGSDVTILLRPAKKDALKAALDAMFAQARGETKGAKVLSETYEGVASESLMDESRRVSCQRAWLGDTCVVSNSPAALRRVIDVQAGRRPSLAAEPDFRYMRAVPLRQTPGEDGFIYLSDAFIRRLVGPELRIKNKRRLEAATSLKLLTNAVMYHGYRFGPGEPKLADLVKSGSLNADDLYDLLGGEFAWDDAQHGARSDLWGDLTFLTPLIEIEAGLATAKEREQYEQFRNRYQSYWRNYFDPIGARLTIGPTLAVETHILPLIDLSEYDRFEDVSGGEPIAVRVDQFSDATLLRYVMRLREGAGKQQALALIGMVTQTNAASDWVGEWVTFWVEDTDAFYKLVRKSFEPAGRAEPGPQEIIDVFNASFVLGVNCRNKVSLATFLIALRTMVNQTAPNTVVFNNLPEYKGVSIVQIAPTPNTLREIGIPEAGEGASDHDGAAEPAAEGKTTGSPAAGQQDAADRQDAGAAATAPVREVAPALYYATIGDGFYVSTQAQALRNLTDKLAAPAPAGAVAAAPKANVLLYAAPAAAERIRPTVSYLLEQGARTASIANMGQIWLLGRCGVAGPAGRDGSAGADADLDTAARSYLGYALRCPDGGTYRLDAATLEVTSSVHGPLSSPKRLEAPPADSPLSKLLSSIQTVLAKLEFTEHGVATEVRIRRR